MTGNKKTIITSGSHFIDIDAYACMYAYKELMTLQGQSAIAHTTATINASVTEKYRELDSFLASSEEFENTDEKSFIVMDVSDPKYFDQCVEVDKVCKVIDHHPGFVEYWNERIAEEAIIEPIGAAATLIYREYVASGYIEKMSLQSAELLAAAIISNTLNFGAKITVQEDKDAYSSLLAIAQLDESFAHEYFLDVQKTIEQDISQALIEDSKSLTIGSTDYHIAQLEIWNAQEFLALGQNAIMTHLEAQPAKIAFLNLIELGAGRNTVIFRDQDSLAHMQKCFDDWEFDEKRFVAKTPRLMLRKEILTKLYQ